jgi:hypothetical protein
MRQTSLSLVFRIHMHDGRSEHASHTLPNKAYYGVKLCELGIIQVAGGAGFYTGPRTRPAKSSIATQVAQQQIICGRLLSASPSPLDKRKTRSNPRSLANPIASSAPPSNASPRRRRTPPRLRLSSQEHTPSLPERRASRRSCPSCSLAAPTASIMQVVSVLLVSI